MFAFFCPRQRLHSLPVRGASQGVGIDGRFVEHLHSEWGTTGPVAVGQAQMPAYSFPSSFSPAMPAAMSSTQRTWGRLSRSWNSSTPSSVVPTMPKPVHMA